MSSQLEIDGIGQQKATLADWRRENEVFTHHAPHVNKEDMQWTCWDETDDPGEFLGRHGDDAFGFGKTEREAITDFCTKHGIDLPFWWRG